MMAKRGSKCGTEKVMPETDNEKQRSISVQDLPRRASARAAADAIRTSLRDGKSPSPATDAPLAAADKKSVPTTRSHHACKIRKCTVNLVRLEDYPTLRKLLHSPHAKDVRKRIVDGTLTITLEPENVIDKCKVKEVCVGESPAKQRKQDTTTSTSSNNHRSSLTSSEPVECVVVGPKPGAKIVNWERPSRKGGTGKKTPVVTNHVTLNQKNKLLPQTGPKIPIAEQQGSATCEVCFFTFKSVRNKLTHKRMAHPELGAFSCFSCGGCFKSAEDLECHSCGTDPQIKDGQTDPSRSSCTVFAVFPDKSKLLISQRKTHGQNPHQNNTNTPSIDVTKSAACKSDGAPSKPCTQQIIIAEPNGKYTQLDKLNVTKTDMITATASNGPGQNGKHINREEVRNAATCVSTNQVARQMTFLCEVCLETFPSDKALDSHTCVAAAPHVVGDQSVPHEVQQLARFYSSIVFQEF